MGMKEDVRQLLRDLIRELQYAEEKLETMPEGDMCIAFDFLRSRLDPARATLSALEAKYESYDVETGRN